MAVVKVKVNFNKFSNVLKMNFVKNTNDLLTLIGLNTNKQMSKNIQETTGAIFCLGEIPMTQCSIGSIYH